MGRSMGDHVEQLKTISLKAIQSITSKRASKVIDNFLLSLDKRETSRTVPKPEPSTSRSDIELSLSDADSGFIDQPNDSSRNQQQAVPRTDLPTLVPVVDLHVNRVDDGVINSRDPNFEQGGKFGVEPDFGQSQEGPIDVNVSGNFMSINNSHNAMIIDEKDIAVGSELELETFSDKSGMDKARKIGLNVNIHSTPVAKEYGTIDYGQFTNSYKTEYRNGSFVHDLTNNIKFTVKSDGLVFSGLNILSDLLE